MGREMERWIGKRERKERGRDDRRERKKKVPCNPFISCNKLAADCIAFSRWIIISVNTSSFIALFHIYTH